MKDVIERFKKVKIKAARAKEAKTHKCVIVFNLPNLNAVLKKSVIYKAFTMMLSYSKVVPSSFYSYTS